MEWIQPLTGENDILSNDPTYTAPSGSADFSENMTSISILESRSILVWFWRHTGWRCFSSQEHSLRFFPFHPSFSPFSFLLFTQVFQTPSCVFPFHVHPSSLSQFLSAFIPVFPFLVFTDPSVGS